MQWKGFFVVIAVAVSLAAMLRTITVTAANEQGTQYFCPMDPDVRSNTPGVCSRCGMSLKAISPSQKPADPREQLSSPPHRSTTDAPRTTRWGADYFPNVPLTTQDGKKVRFYDDLLKDKLVAIDLIYTTCKYNCPLETARLAQVQKLMGDRVGKDIFFYSISIDPKNDTPEALKAYAEKFGVGPGWLFLTGKEEDIELISKKLGLYSEPNPSNPDGHTPTLMVGNVPTGQWMKNSALDNPRFLAVMIGQVLDTWKRRPQEAMKTYVEAPQLNVTKGQYLFSTRCSACHTIGRGARVGPDLLGVTHVRNRAWLSRVIRESDKMLAENDPVVRALFSQYKQVRMPNLSLSPTDAEILIDYLASQSDAADVKAGVGAPAIGHGSDSPR